ncbi:MAG TPA: alpha/beta hydrolase [Magnetospirillaceae bacterium]|nr:alpha/beta hydrolase [Magnetospirillaceae bacterium]
MLWNQVTHPGTGAFWYSCDMRLLEIGGLGDHDFRIRLVLPVWRLYGFEPRYEPFFWQLGDDDLQARLDPILAWIDALPRGEQIVIVGSSAGGVIAALLLLLRPNRIRRVVAISSPLNRFKHSKNKLLNTALAEFDKRFSQADPLLRARIGSFRGRLDDIVRPTFSVVPGAFNHQLPTRGHVWTIAMALTWYSRRLSSYLSR